jgi:hypothetical protein
MSTRTPGYATIESSEWGSLFWDNVLCTAKYNGIDYTRLFFNDALCARDIHGPLDAKRKRIALGNPSSFSFSPFPRKIVLEFHGRPTCVLKPDRRYDPAVEAGENLEIYKVYSSTMPGVAMYWCEQLKIARYNGKKYERCLLDGEEYGMERLWRQQPSDFRIKPGVAWPPIEIVFCSDSLADVVFTLSPPAREAVDVVPGEPVYWDSFKRIATYQGTEYGFPLTANGVQALSDYQLSSLGVMTPTSFRHREKELVVEFKTGGYSVENYSFYTKPRKPLFVKVPHEWRDDAIYWSVDDCTAFDGRGKVYSRMLMGGANVDMAIKKLMHLNDPVHFTYDTSPTTVLIRFHKPNVTHAFATS